MKKITIACCIIAFLLTVFALNAIADYQSKQIFEATRKAVDREFMGWHGDQRVFFDGKDLIYE